MGGVVNDILNGVGLSDSNARRDAADRQARDAKAKADEEAAQLEQQKRVVESQKEAEQLALNARKKRAAAASSGTSGFLNITPASQNSILG